MLAGVGVLEDVEAFGICGHEAVFDAVVDHLHEVTGAVRAAVQPAVVGGRLVAAASFGRRRGGHAGGERLERGREMRDRVVGAADHLAVAPLESPDPARDAHVDVADALLGEALRTAKIVLVVGVAAIDEDVAFAEMRHELVDHAVDERHREHHPGGLRAFELRGEVGDVGGPDRAIRFEGLHGVGIHVVDHAADARLHHPADHARSHAAEAEHSQLQSIAAHRWLS